MPARRPDHSGAHRCSKTASAICHAATWSGSRCPRARSRIGWRRCSSPSGPAPPGKLRRRASHPETAGSRLRWLSAAREPSLAVLKTVGVSPGNTARGLPHIGGVIVVHDGESGMPIAILDAGHITAVRTAAISLVAARRLARVDSRSIGFVGCGVQAASHLDALASELPIERIVAFSRRRESAEALCARAAATGIAGQVAEDAGDAIAGVDIVVSSIPDQPGLRPFLDAGRLRPGALAIGVDLGRSWIPETLSAFDRIAVDDLRRHAAGPLVTTVPVEADLHTLIAEPRRHRSHRPDRLHVQGRRPRRPRGGIDLSPAGPGARRGGDAGTLASLTGPDSAPRSSAVMFRPMDSRLRGNDGRGACSSFPRRRESTGVCRSRRPRQRTRQSPAFPRSFPGPRRIPSAVTPASTRSSISSRP